MTQGKAIVDPYSHFRSRTIDSDSGCWEWQGALNNHGYAHANVGGKRWYVHRWMYTHLIGPIPEGMELDHLCRNTKCVNPAHLEAVTHRENIRRGRTSEVAGKYATARAVARTHCSRGHELVPYEGPGTSRRCRTCNALRMDKLKREAGVPARPLKKPRIAVALGFAVDPRTTIGGS